MIKIKMVKENAMVRTDCSALLDWRSRPDWARELPKHAPLRLLLHIPHEEAQRAKERGLAAALTHYFELRAEWIERDKRELFQLGWRYLAVGIVVLVILRYGK